jgi:hypothetical protein
MGPIKTVAPASMSELGQKPDSCAAANSSLACGRASEASDRSRRPKVSATDAPHRESWSVRGQWEGGETREWDSLKAGRCRIHTGGKHASRLLVPVVALGSA